jgi:hypothetical protein
MSEINNKAISRYIELLDRLPSLPPTPPLPVHTRSHPSTTESEIIDIDEYFKEIHSQSLLDTTIISEQKTLGLKDRELKDWEVISVSELKGKSHKLVYLVLGILLLVSVVTFLRFL